MLDGRIRTRRPLVPSASCDFVVATCSVDYVGKLSAHLPMATRLLLVKSDGSVSVHADDRAYKPLNWMSPPCTLKDETSKKERRHLDSHQQDR